MEKKIELKEEQADIKKFISQGKISVYRDVYSEEISMSLPVKYEDLVVEKEENGEKQVLRIPICKEYYDTVKRKDTINDVETYRKIFSDVKHIPVDLKKEKLKIKNIREQIDKFK